MGSSLKFMIVILLSFLVFFHFYWNVQNTEYMLGIDVEDDDITFVVHRLVNDEDNFRYNDVGNNSVVYGEGKKLELWLDEDIDKINLSLQAFIPRNSGETPINLKKLSIKVNEEKFGYENFPYEVLREEADTQTFDIQVRYRNIFGLIDGYKASRSLTIYWLDSTDFEKMRSVMETFKTRPWDVVKVQTVDDEGNILDKIVIENKAGVDFRGVEVNCRFFSATEEVEDHRFVLEYILEGSEEIQIPFPVDLSSNSRENYDQASCEIMSLVPVVE